MLSLSDPVHDFSPGAFDGQFAVRLLTGNLKLEFTQKDDPDWKEGNPGFTVALTEKDKDPAIGGFGGGGGGGFGGGEAKPIVKKVKKVFGKARVKWTLDKITIQIEGETPGLPSPAAILYTEENEGALELETNAYVSYGFNANSQVSFKVSLKGAVKHKGATAGNVSGSVTTIELKGEGKTAVN